MTRTPSLLANLLADCDAHGIRLALADGGGLAIDAPHDALTPDLLDRLKAHKADLLAILRPAPDLAAPVNQADAAAVWQAALDRLEGDPSFPPDAMEALRAAEVRWGDAPLPVAPRGSRPKRTKPVCRCGSTAWRVVPIHGGQSVRRECGRCGRFRDFPVWYGRYTGHHGQHPIELVDGQTSTGKAE